MSNLIVILDNGHGKNTKGKCSPDKTLYEWKWARDIVSTIYHELLKLKIDAYLLVPEDKDVPLNTGSDNRVKRVNTFVKQAKKANKECVLISVHVNAAGGDGKWHSARGWSGWVANCASDKSKKLAQLLYEECEKRYLQGNRCVPSCKYWEANFAITRDTNCPAVLTENLFQDNEDDVKILNSEIGKETIVSLHVDAIKKYIDSI